MSVALLALLAIGPAQDSDTGPAAAARASTAPSSTTSSPAPVSTVAPAAPLPDTSSAPATSSASSAPTTEPAPQVPAIQVVPVGIPTRVVVRDQAGDVRLDVAVDACAMTAPNSNCGSPAGIDPPSLGRAVWVSETGDFSSNAPEAPALYAHACGAAAACAFDPLVSVQVGDSVEITLTTGLLTFRVDEPVQEISKYGETTLNDKPRTVANHVVLITCAYDSAGNSPDNLVVSAELVAAVPAG